MASKVMLEATQDVVAGNEVAVHAGELFEPGAKLPEGVTVRPVIVAADDEPAPAPASASAAPVPAQEPSKPPARPPVK